MVNTDVDVDSTVADVIGGIVGFFSGFLFSGVGSIPLAIAGAMGTDAIIDGIASDQLPQGPFKFADRANSEFSKSFSPCEIFQAFDDLASKQLRTKSVSSGLVVLSLEQGRPVAGPAFQARHNLTGTQYQTEFDRLAGQGYRLVDVSGYQDGGAVRYTGIWDQAPGPAWAARHGVTGAQYQAAFDELGAQGFRPVRINGFSDGNQARFAAIWEPATAPWAARHGMTGAEYQAEFERMGAQGFRLVDVSSYRDGGPARFAAIWEQSPGPAWQARHGMTNAQYQAEFDRLAAQGYRLVRISGYEDGGDRYAAIWEQTSGPAWQARHNLSAADYQATFDQLLFEGYRLVQVSGYTVGGQARFAAIWTQGDGSSPMPAPQRTVPAPPARRRPHRPMSS
jgi:Bacterial tandem repeat domain 1